MLGLVCKFADKAKFVLTIFAGVQKLGIHYSRIGMIGKTIIQTIAVAGLTAGLMGCCSHNPPAASPIRQDGGAIHARNEGYSILYRLMSDESEVDKILIIKSVDDPLKPLIKQIASTCSDAKKQLDEYQKEDGHSEFDEPDLPRLEQETRDLEAKLDEKELLSSSGPTFALRLVLTQMQAMRYGDELCQALVPAEDNPQRKDFLKQLSGQLGDYHDRLVNLIQVR